MELSTYIHIDCLSLLTCSSYYSMRGVVYGGVLYIYSIYGLGCKAAIV